MLTTIFLTAIAAITGSYVFNTSKYKIIANRESKTHVVVADRRFGGGRGEVDKSLMKVAIFDFAALVARLRAVVTTRSHFLLES